MAYGSRSSPPSSNRPAPVSQPAGAATCHTRRSAGRHSPIQVPPTPSTRSATEQASGVSTCPGWIANGVITHSAGHSPSGNRTGSVEPSTPQPSRCRPGEGASERISSSPLSGSAVTSRSSLSAEICSSGETSQPRARSTTTVLVRPPASRSRASIRPSWSSHTPPEQRPRISPRCSGPQEPPATSHTAVDPPGLTATA